MTNKWTQGLPSKKFTIAEKESLRKDDFRKNKNAKGCKKKRRKEHKKERPLKRNLHFFCCLTVHGSFSYGACLTRMLRYNANMKSECGRTVNCNVSGFDCRLIIKSETFTKPCITIYVKIGSQNQCQSNIQPARLQGSPRICHFTSLNFREHFFFSMK